MSDEKKHASLVIDNTFDPVQYDPQYILMVNALKKYFQPETRHDNGAGG